MTGPRAWIGLLALAAATGPAGAAEAACREESAAKARYVVCAFDPGADDIRLFLNDETGAPYGDFAPLAAALAAKGERLVFAMNAGMYLKDRSPAGFYVENYEVKKELSTRDGPGNFHMKPNGVFWIDATGAHIAATEAFLALLSSPVYGGGVAEGDGGGGTKAPPLSAARTSPPQAGEKSAPAHATQSGPMLVIDGALHPRFLADATSRKRRNGVGVCEGGRVAFVLADTPVTFYEFATYFRDRLGCPNALYLDGTISRLYSPELGRDDAGAAMGPIIGVVARD